jgi:hypothetical protein
VTGELAQVVAGGAGGLAEAAGQLRGGGRAAGAQLVVHAHAQRVGERVERLGGDLQRLAALGLHGLLVGLLGVLGLPWLGFRGHWLRHDSIIESKGFFAKLLLQSLACNQVP